MGPGRSAETEVPLGGLRKGARAEIVGFGVAGLSSSSPDLVPRGGITRDELERRLIEMGLVEGARIEILHEGFPGRDPIAIKVGDHTVALRRAEANAVMVRRLGI